MTEVAIDFATYGTKPSGDRSGAYLFLPDGPAEVSAFWSVAGQCTQSHMKMSEICAELNGNLLSCMKGWDLHFQVV